MAAKGTLAKENVIKILADTFGQNYLGEHDKKIYIMANDGGEMVQIAISLTCPKVPVEFDSSVNTDTGDWDFSDDAPKSAVVAVASAEPAEITETEMDNLASLMAKLGL